MLKTAQCDIIPDDAHPFVVDPIGAGAIAAARRTVGQHTLVSGGSDLLSYSDIELTKYSQVVVFFLAFNKNNILLI